MKYDPSNIHKGIERVDATEQWKAPKPLGRSGTTKPYKMEAPGNMPHPIQLKKKKPQ